MGLDSRWRNLVVLAAIIALAAAAYFYFPKMTQQTSETEKKIDSVFQKYGISISSFEGKLLVQMENDKLVTKLPNASYAGLIRDLNALRIASSSAQEKELVAIYADVVALSQEKYLVLSRLDSISRKISPSDANSACHLRGEIDSINLDFTDFFISANSLALREADYIQKYSAAAPIGLNLNDDRNTMESISLLSELYYIACVEAA